MYNKEILMLIENISPHAKDYVDKAFENNKVEVLYSISTEQNKGVFIIVNNDDCCIFYASFLNENNVEQILEVINNKTKEYVSKIKSKEICFNVYGNNLKIINLVRKLGFKADMEGYHLEYIGEELPQLNNYNLTDKGFESSMSKEFVDLFDSSYYQLNIDNGWKINSHAVNEEKFHQELNELNKFSQVRSFWLNNELVGAYIFEQNYITDIVVKPIFQNKGYGSYILAHCIRNMNLNKSIKNIRLRVAKSNVGAKKLYERNNFVDIACFAEHTYVQVL
ncbi:GNAT family N-acetyltransferase [Clostridium frigidicarnis]|uniref:Acetyltransferase (GNAT) domain-containing protein n=1 Tax=Clostridium frigidicarnis TaxID=84698 RepID=A0A1I0YCT0_9CLOT|nr:GNAT family N-acetyltransferase [Clostridium frigidicarnis]SFB10290.1 Acetyltransferase (GNAT) domain-containing protein [Clostridium frigidicarnis]